MSKSVPERSQLRDQHDSGGLKNDAKELDDVGVLDGLHDLVLLHELEHAVLQTLLA